MMLKPYLQLVRLPNVFTAAADSLAGWLLGGGSLGVPGRWGPLVGASMAIYAGGIVLNDLFDYEIDRVERPDRPLPSGRIRRRSAALLGAGLLLLGLGLAAGSGSTASLRVAALLVAAVLAYDAGAKRTALGPEVMGACRGLNVLLGLSQAERFGGPSAWLVATAIGLFVVGVTWISRSETESGRARGIVAGSLVQGTALLGLMIAALRANTFPGAEVRSLGPVGGLAVLAAVTLTVLAASVRAARQPLPAHAQQAVKTGVLALVWLHVGVVAAVRGPVPALAVAAWWVPAFLLSRWLYTT